MRSAFREDAPGFLTRRSSHRDERLPGFLPWAPDCTLAGVREHAAVGDERAAAICAIMNPDSKAGIVREKRRQSRR